MCPTEKIPSVNHSESLAERLEVVSSRRSDEAVDLNTLDWPYESLDDVVDELNDDISHLDVPGLRDYLLNNGRIRIPFELSSDYENIFSIDGLSRRNDRPVWTPGDPVPQGDEDGLMEEWAIHTCLRDPDPEFDHFHPGDMTEWPQIMHNYMPARLTLDTWVAKLMLCQVATLLMGDPRQYKLFQIWRTEFGDGGVETIMLPGGGKKDVFKFVGEAGPGRLVMRRPQGFEVPNGEEMRAYHAEARWQVRQVEEALVALARRIARHTATQVVYKYAIPEAEKQGRAVLDRKQIETAVREILGEEGFDLPFDLDGSLRNWSIDDVTRPDHEIDGMDVFIVLESEDDGVDECVDEDEDVPMYMHY